MNYRFWIISLFAMLFTISVSAQDQVKSKNASASYLKKVEKQKAKANKENARQKQAKTKAIANVVLEKTKGTVYVFGVSTDLKSKDVYITDISTIDSLALQAKTGFLPFRTSFSIQLQQYTEGKLGKVNQTVSVYFEKDKKKLRKKLDKVQKFYMEKSVNTLNNIELKDFHFIHPVDLIAASDE